MVELGIRMMGRDMGGRMWVCRVGMLLIMGGWRVWGLVIEMCIILHSSRILYTRNLTAADYV